MANGHYLAERAELAAHSEETITAAIQHSGKGLGVREGMVHARGRAGGGVMRTPV